MSGMPRREGRPVAGAERTGARWKWTGGGEAVMIKMGNRKQGWSLEEAGTGMAEAWAERRR